MSSTLRDIAPIGPTAAHPGLGLDDYQTVELLAAGLARMHLNRQHARKSLGPEDRIGTSGALPRAWRTAVTRLWWTGLAQLVDWPGDDLDVFAACRRPLDAWPIRLDLTEDDRGQVLLEGDDLSEFAEQSVALAGRQDVEAELVENRVFGLLMAAAQANGRTPEEIQAAYVALRLLLVHQPVLSDLDIIKRVRAMPAATPKGEPYVKDLVRAAYRFQPAPGTVTVRVCDSCGNPLTAPLVRCPVAGCPGQARALTMPTLEGYWVQNRATRRFHHDAGLVEDRLFQRSDALAAQLAEDDFPVRVTLERYPLMDTWDGSLRFTYGDGISECWLFDAKDTVSATLLGRCFSPPPEPEAARRFLVLAQHRATPAYRGDLERELHGRVRGITVIDETTFLRQAAQHARRLGGRA
ncbi:restriction endonuclease-related protein [Streptomyces nigrescens]|uniref:restriction endonuclease-related protein n=1 Tax=Streptomyces nigrescens TaxID=1920 RepID=UPI0036A7CD24